MSLEHQVAAIRTGVGLHLAPQPAVLRVCGSGAFELLERWLPSELALRDGTARPSLLLDERARPLADVLVARDDEDFLVYVLGLDADAVTSRFGTLPGTTVQPLGMTHALLSLHGPWAWELLGEVFEPGLSAIPYLNLFRVEDLVCVRAGCTGEYGYDLLVPHGRVAEVEARCLEHGARYGLRKVSDDALRACALENWFFHPALVPEGDVTPVELQLQWRLSTRRDYRGRARVQQHLADGPRELLTCLSAGEALEPGDAIHLDGRPIGRVTHAERSPTRGDHVALALLERRRAFGGIDAYRVVRDGRAIPVRTVAPPLVNNRSLFVDPRRHTFAYRDEIVFPSAVRGQAP